jgi:hypothetical protein
MLHQVLNMIPELKTSWPYLQAQKEQLHGPHGSSNVASSTLVN